MLDVNLPRILVALLTAAVILGVSLVTRWTLSRLAGRHRAAEERLAGEAIGEVEKLGRGAFNELATLEHGAVNAVEGAVGGVGREFRSVEQGIASHLPGHHVEPPEDIQGAEALAELLMLIPKSKRRAASQHIETLTRLLTDSQPSQSSQGQVDLGIGQATGNADSSSVGQRMGLTRLDLVSALATEREIARTMEAEREHRQHADSPRLVAGLLH
jgi:hypothetical protein